MVVDEEVAVVRKREERGEKVKVHSCRAKWFQPCMRSCFCRCLVERAVVGWTGVRVARGEVPFQVNRGRMERGTSAIGLGGVILIVYQKRRFMKEDVKSTLRHAKLVVLRYWKCPRIQKWPENSLAMTKMPP